MEKSRRVYAFLNETNYGTTSLYEIDVKSESEVKRSNSDPQFAVTDRTEEELEENFKIESRRINTNFSSDDNNKMPKMCQKRATQLVVDCACWQKHTEKWILVYILNDRRLGIMNIDEQLSLTRNHKTITPSKLIEISGLNRSIIQIESTAIHPNIFLLVAQANLLYIVLIEKKELMKVWIPFHSIKVLDCQWIPNRQCRFIILGEEFIQIWSMKGMKLKKLSSLHLNRYELNSFDIHPYIRWIAAVGNDKHIHFWRWKEQMVDKLTTVASKPMRTSVNSLLFSGNSTTSTTNTKPFSGSPTILLEKIMSTSIRTESSMNRVRWCPSTNYFRLAVLSCSADKFISIWDVHLNRHQNGLPPAVIFHKYLHNSTHFNWLTSSMILVSNLHQYVGIAWNHKTVEQKNNGNDNLMNYVFSLNHHGRVRYPRNFLMPKSLPKVSVRSFVLKSESYRLYDYRMENESELDDCQEFQNLRAIKKLIASYHYDGEDILEVCEWNKQLAEDVQMDDVRFLWKLVQFFIERMTTPIDYLLHIIYEEKRSRERINRESYLLEMIDNRFLLDNIVAHPSFYDAELKDGKESRRSSTSSIDEDNSQELDEKSSSTSSIHTQPSMSSNEQKSNYLDVSLVNMLPKHCKEILLGRRNLKNEKKKNEKKEMVLENYNDRFRHRLLSIRNDFYGIFLLNEEDNWENCSFTNHLRPFFRRFDKPEIWNDAEIDLHERNLSKTFPLVEFENFVLQSSNSFQQQQQQQQQQGDRKRKKRKIIQLRKAISYIQIVTECLGTCIDFYLEHCDDVQGITVINICLMMLLKKYCLLNEYYEYERLKNNENEFNMNHLVFSQQFNINYQSSLYDSHRYLIKKISLWMLELMNEVCLSSTDFTLVMDEYLHVINSFEMFDRSVELMKNPIVSHLSINTLDCSDMFIRIGCADCKNGIMQTASPRINSEIMTSSCEKCHKSLSCVVCELPVNGLYLWCNVCEHGGHPKHMIDWFTNGDVKINAENEMDDKYVERSSKVTFHGQCPSGCGHICYLSLNSIFFPSQTN
ncbi:hypothetical protein SNEBB_007516 [Seison nebaliae]|nr:hypothetical protein SNEBB_007516 [Seison nebaliae]